MGKRNKGFIMAGLTLGGLLLIGSPAGAQPYHHPYNLDQRQDYQQHQIQQGIDSGTLTPGEARYLEREQARIQAMEERMRADGHLSPWERRRLREMQERASRDIYRLEHNRRGAEDWNGNHYGWGEHRRSRWNEHGRHYGWQGDSQGGWGDQAYGPRYSGRQAGWQGNYNGWGGGGYGWQGNNSSQTGTTTTTNTQGWRGNRYGGGGSTTGTSTNGATLGGNSLNGTTTRGTTTGVTTTTGSTTGNIPSWPGNQTGGNVTSTNGTTTSGTATTTNTQGWQGRRYGGNGYTPGGTATNGTTASGTTSAANTQAWRGNYSGGNWNNTYARSGPAGAFRQPVPQARSFSQPANWQGQPRFQQARPQMPQTMMRPNAPMMARQPGGFAGTVNRANFSPIRTAPRRR